MTNGDVLRFGSHNCHNDDGRKLVIRDGRVFIESDMRTNEHPTTTPTELPNDVLAANGYYDYEHDAWTPIVEFANREFQQ